MFRKSASARYILRAIVAATLAGLGALTTALADGAVSALELTLIATAIFGSFGAYLGIGASSGAVEPFIGPNKLEHAAVPVPPADPEPAEPT